VLAYEVEERGQIRRKQQCRPTQTRSWSVPPDQWVRPER
jgi:hypothetical protein